jgi:flagellar biosynthetic protein FliR
MTGAALLEWAPAFVLVLARIGPAMMLLPGLGETTVLSSLRIGLALSLTILLLPSLKPLMPQMPAAGAAFGSMVACEAFTGIWFGWLARQTALVLPMMGQLAAYQTGLSSVLQPDADLGPQTTALSKLFEMMTPVLFLTTGLYRLPLLSLRGLFQLIPPGTLLPASDGAESAIAAAGSALALAVQLASPFIVMAVVWHVMIGIIGRMAARMQIYFVSAPGQILVGFLILILAGSAILSAWQIGVGALLLALPHGS